MFFPVTFLGMYSPFAIRLLLRSAQRSGRVSGAVYGVSTAGSIVGTLGTTFFLIPTIGSRAITLTLGAVGLISGLGLLALSRLERRASGALAVVLLASAALTATPCRAESLIDEGVRAAMLKRGNGRIAHIETEYNDVFITKRQNQLAMSFQVKGWDYTESVANLTDRRRPAAALRAGDDDRDRLSRDAEEYPDARARRRLDLDLSRTFHAGGGDHHRRDRPRRDQRRQDLFRPARDRAHALPRRRRARLPQPQQRDCTT